MSLKPKALSPSKQNQSPTKPQKFHDPITELLSYIKAAGLKLPAHIEKLLNTASNSQNGGGGGSMIKLIPTEQAQAGKDGDNGQLQKMRVRLGDTEFQLKKLEEDFAQFKLNSRLEREKQVKKWQQAYNHLKNTLESNNEDSSLKLLKLRQTSQTELQNLTKKHEAQLHQQKQKLTKNYEQKLSTLKKLHERQIKQLKQKSATQLQKVKEKYQGELRDLRDGFEVEMKRVLGKNREVLENKEKQFQSIYTAIQSQKKTQEKLHEKTRIQASQAKEKLYSQLYFQRNVKKNLEQTIQKREADIKSLKSQIHNLEIDLILQSQKHQKKQSQIHQQFQKKLLSVEQLHKQHITNLLSTHENELRKYSKSIQQITEWKDNKQALLLEKCQQIQAKFDERPSRQEDLDMIEKLRARMLRKEEQLRMLNKELKICVLESQNKEETYNKIFTSNTMNKFEKKCLSKDREEFKSKESLCRKSQTTDIKFLLKVYNKHL